MFSMFQLPPAVFSHVRMGALVTMMTTMWIISVPAYLATQALTVTQWQHVCKQFHLVAIMTSCNIEDYK